RPVPDVNDCDATHRTIRPMTPSGTKHYGLRTAKDEGPSTRDYLERSAAREALRMLRIELFPSWHPYSNSESSGWRSSVSAAVHGFVHVVESSTVTSYCRPSRSRLKRSMRCSVSPDPR